jgi:hypothetical protein
MLIAREQSAVKRIGRCGWVVALRDGASTLLVHPPDNRLPYQRFRPDHVVQGRCDRWAMILLRKPIEQQLEVKRHCRHFPSEHDPKSIADLLTDCAAM